MSNYIINIMVLGWHLQIEQDWKKFVLSYNKVHYDSGWPNGYVRVFKFFKYNYVRRKYDKTRN